MDRHPVQSSTIASVGYDETRSMLEIEFRSGRVYQYFLVPIYVYEGLVTAPSKGTFLIGQIRGKFPYKESRQ